MVLAAIARGGSYSDQRRRSRDETDAEECECCREVRAVAELVDAQEERESLGQPGESHVSGNSAEGGSRALKVSHSHAEGKLAELAKVAHEWSVGVNDARTFSVVVMMTITRDALEDGAPNSLKTRLLDARDAFDKYSSALIQLNAVLSGFNVAVSREVRASKAAAATAKAAAEDPAAAQIGWPVEATIGITSPTAASAVKACVETRSGAVAFARMLKALAQSYSKKWKAASLSRGARSLLALVQVVDRSYPYYRDALDNFVGEGVTITAEQAAMEAARARLGSPGAPGAPRRARAEKKYQIPGVGDAAAADSTAAVGIPAAYSVRSAADASRETTVDVATAKELVVVGGSRSLGSSMLTATIWARLTMLFRDYEAACPAAVRKSPEHALCGNALSLLALFAAAHIR
jgi:hypothetical protein